MKKSILLLIGVIAILSIFVVTFFGTTANLDQFKVYIDTVEITKYDRIDNEGKENEKKYIFLTFDEEIGEASTFIDYKILPNNATEKSNIEFSFVLDESVLRKEDDGMTYYEYIDQETGETVLVASLSRIGEVTFYRVGAVWVKLASKDGLERSDKVFVRCR